jgi:hypothetical protein
MTSKKFGFAGVLRSLEALFLGLLPICPDEQD